MKAMCDETGISYGTLKNQKAKDRIPDVVDCIKIADYLNISLRGMFNMDNPDKKEFPDDIYRIAVGLSQLTPEQREPLVFMIQGQIEFYKNKDK